MMRNIWIMLSFCGVAFLVEETISVRAQSQAPGDDLFLDNQQSGDYPVDDDDFNSGSGSGVDDLPEAMATVNTLYIAPEVESTQVPSDSITTVEAFSSRDSARKLDRNVPTALSTVGLPDDNKAASATSTPNIALGGDKSFNVRSENLFQRTEVLAAVIAGGVIGFIFAIFLILLLVYRLRKKDEGSYDLGDRKPCSSAYQRTPTKEFYA